MARITIRGVKGKSINSQSSVAETGDEIKSIFSQVLVPAYTESSVYVVLFEGSTSANSYSFTVNGLPPEEVRDIISQYYNK